nr:helix-turn-helix domain-containing protein [Desulfobacterales bacterium]
LLYRMDVVSLTIPPLRQRPEDVPVLVAKMIELYGDSPGAVNLAPETMAILAGYHWPGNIRELRSVITKTLIFSEGDTIRPDDLPRHLVLNQQVPARPLKTLEEMEKNHIIAVLAEAGGNQSRAAEILGINRKTLYKKIHKFKIFS